MEKTPKNDNTVNFKEPLWRTHSSHRAARERSVPPAIHTNTTHTLLPRTTACGTMGIPTAHSTNWRHESGDGLSHRDRETSGPECSSFQWPSTCRRMGMQYPPQMA